MKVISQRGLGFLAGMRQALGNLSRGCTRRCLKLLFNKVIKGLKSEVALLVRDKFDHKKRSPSQLDKKGRGPGYVRKHPSLMEAIVKCLHLFRLR